MMLDLGQHWPETEFGHWSATIAFTVITQGPDCCMLGRYVGFDGKFTNIKNMDDAEWLN